MRVLVLNAGSSSLKYKLFAMPAEEALAWGVVERLGEPEGDARAIHHRPGAPGRPRPAACPGHARAAELILAELADLGGPQVAGHRVVHGRDAFTRPCLIDDDALALLREIAPLAPLHNPPALAVIEACREALGAAPQAACFDTIWHQTMPDHTRLYPVPPEWEREHGVRRYGFHGISHQYLTLTAAGLMGRPADELRLITCHLGNGASLCAWDRGRVLDTSMGFTPLEGIMMGTRPGDLDPALVPYLAQRLGIDAAGVIDRLNRDCGLAGVSGRGRDLRDILAARAAGDDRARLALDMFVHRLRKCLGGYLLALGGCEGVIFSGGIGQRSPQVRAAALAGAAPLGLDLDPAANAAASGDRPVLISRPAGAVQVWVIPTDEELMIARESFRLAKH